MDKKVPEESSHGRQGRHPLILRLREKVVSVWRLVWTLFSLEAIKSWRIGNKTPQVISC